MVVMVSSETVHVRSVFSAKIVYAFIVVVVFVCFLMKTIKNVTDFLFVDLTCMLTMYPFELFKLVNLVMT